MEEKECGGGARQGPRGEGGHPGGVAGDDPHGFLVAELDFEVRKADFKFSSY